MRGLRSHLTYANVMSTLAVVLVIGGGAAYAANTVFSSDIVDGQVKTADLANTAVTTDKLAGGSVTSEKVKNDNLTGGDVAFNTLKGADIDESTLSTVGGGGAAGGDLTGSYPNPLIGPNAVGGGEVANNSLKGADVDEATLGQVPSALLGGVGRSAPVGDNCDPPEDGTFVVCAATELIDVPPGARALVLGDAHATPDAGTNFGIGDCHLSTSATGPLADTRRTFKVNDVDDPASGALVGVTPPLRPGLTQFGILCQDASGVSGGIRYFQLGISVVLIADN